MEASTPYLAPALAALLAVAFLIARAIWRAQDFVIVHPWEHGLLYQSGRFLRDLPPGRHRIGRTRLARVQTTIPQTTQLAPQEALTADRFALRLSALVTWRLPPETLRAVLEAHAAAPEERLRLAASQALRAVIAAQPLDALLGPRPALDAAFAAALHASPLIPGLEIQSAEIRDLILPAELRRMLTDAERSRREALAALERARGEQAVLRSLANSARMLRGNPALMNLRLLQALTPAQGKARPTIILGGAAGLVPLAPDDAAEPAPPPED